MIGHYVKLTREKPGLISPGTCWCLSIGPWLYIAGTLPGVLWIALTEYRHDRHLVG